MCGRYTLATPAPAAVRERFGLGESVQVRRRYNIAPGDDVLAVTADREGHPRGELLRWGLVPAWAQTPESRLKMINARSETVTERPAFRHSFERFRCLIPADGFYEWSPPASGGRKQAYHIARSDHDLFAFAGLWAIWRGSDSGTGEEHRLRSCAILTTAANSAVARLHDRMPVILPRAAEAAWLDPATPQERLLELLAPLPSEETSMLAVGPAVNDARYDGAECLAPSDETKRQPTLF